MSECVRLGEDPCIERAPQLCIRRGGSCQPSPSLPSYVVIKKDRFARSLARAEAFSFMCQPLSCAAVVQAAVAIGHWTVSTGQSPSGHRLFRGTGRFHKATNKPLLKKKNRRYNNICMGPRREESLPFVSVTKSLATIPLLHNLLLLALLSILLPTGMSLTKLLLVILLFSHNGHD